MAQPSPSSGLALKVGLIIPAAAIQQTAAALGTAQQHEVGGAVYQD